LAQLVNVIAPLMTNESGTLRQTIYYPYAWALKYARGSVLSLAPEGPAYEVPRLGRPVEAGGTAMPGLGRVPYVDVAGTIDSSNKVATLFMLNRDLEKLRELEIDWHEVTPSQIAVFEVITGSDLKAANTFDAPKRVVPQSLEPPKAAARMVCELPAHSYTLLSVRL
jgi:alpha-N-arabinofuranosidase